MTRLAWDASPDLMHVAGVVIDCDVGVAIALVVVLVV